ncbi:hypothetical protein [Methanobrevibacter sp.]|uniref:hypothetical protein n=1 Tax=Methanobrevibacter sp. TaxID=66852 RepID=UPI0025F7A5AF|nr:hypothetical protein [Methanobrevibacter sp.]MBQ6512074.1 hypothetical protein [Methanobrevibacter sp.]
MVLEDVEETVVDKYWNPEKVGDKVEGNVFEIVKDQWNNDRIVLDLGDDEDGNLLTTTLPAHAHLKRFIPNLRIGDYIVVTLKEIIPSEKEGYSDTRIYRVQKDPDRAQDYEEE